MIVCVGCGCAIESGELYVIDQTPGFTHHPAHWTCYDQWVEAHKPGQRPLLMSEKPGVKVIPDRAERPTIGERIARGLARMMWG